MRQRKFHFHHFAYCFIFVTSMFIAIVYFYFLATHEPHEAWLKELVTARILYMPFLLLLIAISAFVSWCLTMLLYFLQRQQYVKIEEKVRLLAQGDLDNPLLKSSLNEESFVEDDLGLYQQLLQIKEKLVKMSGELQTFAHQPVAEGQTKEEIQQEERYRLARELHDSVSQQLFAATMMLSALTEEADHKEVPVSFRKQLYTVTSIINASQSEMRALLLHLRPIKLEGKSLKDGVEMLLRELQTKIQIDLVWEVEDVHLATGVEDHLFRIVQELLSNTLRHAKAHSLELYLKQSNARVLLRMVDDGVGFDMEQEKVGSYGLKNIYERVNGMGGTCKIISFKGKGTSVEIKIPVVKELIKND